MSHFDCCAAETGYCGAAQHAALLCAVQIGSTM